MILTCPECATSYFVDDAKIGAQGRAVRCAGCGARWTAKVEPVLELGSTSEEGAVAAEPRAPAPADAEAPLSEIRADELPKVFRGRAEAKRNIRKAAAVGAVWAVMAACVAAIVGAGVVFKVDVVRLWPRTASAYAMAGMPVNATGLEFEDVAAHPALQDGHAALVVSGKIRNVENRTIAAPPLRIGLFDKAGKKVGTKVSDPENAAIPPGETRHFVVSVLDPPATAKDIEVGFVFEPTKSKTPRSAPAAAPALRGSSHSPPAPTDHLVRGTAPGVIEAQEATPLPIGDPHALPPHG